MTIYGYARVSTTNQSRNNTQEAQIKALKEAGAERIFFDAFTGTQIHRPQFDILLGLLQPGDTLVVTKLDRIARSVLQGVQLIEELLEKGVAVNVINIGVMDNTPTGKLIRNTFLCFAQFERDMIVQRCEEGRRIAKQKPGYREGRPKKDISVERLKELLEMQQNGLIGVSQCCSELDISKTTWYHLIKELGLVENEQIT